MPRDVVFLLAREGMCEHLLSRVQTCLDRRHPVGYLTTFDGHLKPFCDCAWGAYLAEVLRRTRASNEDLVSLRELRCLHCYFR